MDYWEKNGSDITNIINGKLIDYHVSKNAVLDILKIPYKHAYKIKDISECDKNERFSIDESQFINISNQSGIINNLTKNFPLEICKQRNEEVLKK